MEIVDFLGTQNPLRDHLKAKLLSILNSVDSDIDCTRELLRSGLKRLKLGVTVEVVKRDMRAHYYELKAQLKLCESGPPIPDSFTLAQFYSECQPPHEIERVNTEYNDKFYQLFKDMHADQAVSMCCCLLSYCYDKATQDDTERAQKSDKTDKTDFVDIEEDAVVHVTSDEEDVSDDESEAEADSDYPEDEEESSEEEDESSASSEEGDDDENGSPQEKMKNKKRQNAESSEESENEDERTTKDGEDHHEAHEAHPKKKK